MQMIEISKLKPHPRNSEFFDDIHGERWDDFKKSIIRRGVVESIVVTQDLMIVSGHQRVKACQELGIISVPCRVVHYPEQDEQTQNGRDDLILEDLICTNLMQRGVGNVNPMKMAKCIMELERIYGIKVGNPQLRNNFAQAKTQEQLADEIGVSERQLQNYKQLLNLVPDIQDLVERDKVKPTVAYKIIAKLPKEEQQELFDRLGEGGLAKKPSREIENQVELYRQEKESLENKNKKLEQELIDERKKKHTASTVVREIEVEKEVIPDHIILELEQLRNQVKQSEEEKKNIKNRLNKLESEKNQAEEAKKKLEDYLSSDEHGIEKLKKEKERMELEAHISISDLQIKIHKFLEDASPSLFLQGAVAASLNVIKDDLLDSVVALEQFTGKLRDILNAKIDNSTYVSAEYRIL